MHPKFFVLILVFKNIALKYYLSWLLEFLALFKQLCPRRVPPRPHPKPHPELEPFPWKVMSEHSAWWISLIFLFEERGACTSVSAPWWWSSSLSREAADGKRRCFHFRVFGIIWQVYQTDLQWCLHFPLFPYFWLLLLDLLSRLIFF